MKIRTIEMMVGALLIAGIASLLLLALQVSGLTSFMQPVSGYTISAEFSNIGGLKPRAKVSLAGVVVGRVTSVRLDPESFYAKVSIRINDRHLDRLPIDSRASIMTAGLLGDNYIALMPGFDENDFLKEGSIIRVENTDSALALEQLISKFVAGQASAGPKPEESQPKKRNSS